MKKNINKIVKGLIAIFAIKMVVLSGVFFFQSCQQGELFEDKEISLAKKNFKSSINTTINNLNEILINDKGKDDLGSYNRAGEELAEIKLYAIENTSTLDYQDYDNSLLLGDLVNIENTELSVKYSDGSKSNNISENQQLLGVYQISVKQAQNSLQPTLVEAKNFLYSKGLTDLDIQYLLAADSEGPAMSESNLIPVVMQLIAEEQNQGMSSKFDYSSLFGASAYASQIGECAGDALGVSDIALALCGGLNTSVGKALLKKAIRKVAIRALGWVGAAVFVYEFGDCMDWW